MILVTCTSQKHLTWN